MRRISLSSYLFLWRNVACELDARSCASRKRGDLHNDRRSLQKDGSIINRPCERSRKNRQLDLAEAWRDSPASVTWTLDSPFCLVVLLPFDTGSSRVSTFGRRRKKEPLSDRFFDVVEIEGNTRAGVGKRERGTRRNITMEGDSLRLSDSLPFHSLTFIHSSVYSSYIHSKSHSRLWKIRIITYLQRNSLHITLAMIKNRNLKLYSLQNTS